MTRRFLRLLLALLGLGVLCALLALLYNNVSPRPPSRALFRTRLEAVRAASRDWILDTGERPTFVPGDETEALLLNPALMYMVADCARISGDQRLEALNRRYFAIGGPALRWARLVDPSRPFERPDDRYVASLTDYQRWILYAMAPKEVALSPAELADLYSPGKFRLAHLTHQLLALFWYRSFNGETPEMRRLIHRLSTRVANEEAIDFRVTDLYLQRIAVLLAVGRPGLVRRRWVERSLAAQQSDGGWTYSWHGWHPTPPYRFGFSEVEFDSTSHPTAQGLWIAYMLKYRYPKWVDENYR